MQLLQVIDFKSSCGAASGTGWAESVAFQACHRLPSMPSSLRIHTIFFQRTKSPLVKFFFCIVWQLNPPFHQRIHVGGSSHRERQVPQRSPQFPRSQRPARQPRAQHARTRTRSPTADQEARALPFSQHERRTLKLFLVEYEAIKLKLCGLVHVGICGPFKTNLNGLVAGWMLILNRDVSRPLERAGDWVKIALVDRETQFFLSRLSSSTLCRTARRNFSRVLYRTPS